MIVSNDGANATANRLGRGVVTVVPVTSNTERIYPFQVLLTSESTGLPEDSKAQAEQVRSVAVERIGHVSGHCQASTLPRSMRPSGSTSHSDEGAPPKFVERQLIAEISLQSQSTVACASHNNGSGRGATPRLGSVP